VRSITRATSSGTRSAIVATFVIPVVDGAHHLVGHACKASGSKQVNCDQGQPVTVDGKTYTCQSRVVTMVKMTPKTKLSPKNLWWAHGKCGSWSDHLQAHSPPRSARKATSTSP
jgi:hypothetical protein